MSKLSVKKFIILAIIAIGAVACFGFIATNQGQRNAAVQNNLNVEQTTDIDTTSTSGTALLGDIPASVYNEIVTYDGIYIRGDTDWCYIDSVEKFINMRDILSLNIWENKYSTDYELFYKLTSTSRSNYKLLTDIVIPDNEAYDWAPIGGPGRPFTGVFDGNGYTITTPDFWAPDTNSKFVNNSRVYNSSSAGIGYWGFGLFGCVSGDYGSISNLQIVYKTSAGYPSIIGGPFLANSYMYCGALAGMIRMNATIDNCRVEYSGNLEFDCAYGGSRELFIGGMIGGNYADVVGGTAHIKNCIVAGLTSMTATAETRLHMGGIIGNADNTKISSSMFIGDSGVYFKAFGGANDMKVGPIAGSAESGTIHNCLYYYSGSTGISYPDGEDGSGKKYYKHDVLTDDGNNHDIFKHNGAYSVTSLSSFSFESAILAGFTPYGSSSGEGLLTLTKSLIAIKADVINSKDLSEELKKYRWIIMDEGEIGDGKIIQTCFVKFSKLKVYNLMNTNTHKPDKSLACEEYVYLTKGISWNTAISNLKTNSKGGINDRFGYKFLGLDQNEKSTNPAITKDSGAWTGDISYFIIEDDAYVIYAVWEALEYKIQFMVSYTNNNYQNVNYTINADYEFVEYSSTEEQYFKTGNGNTNIKDSTLQRLEEVANEGLINNGIYAYEMDYWWYGSTVEQYVLTQDILLYNGFNYLYSDEVITIYAELKERSFTIITHYYNSNGILAEYNLVNGTRINDTSPELFNAEAGVENVTDLVFANESDKTFLKFAGWTLNDDNTPMTGVTTGYARVTDEDNFAYSAYVVYESVSDGEEGFRIARLHNEEEVRVGGNTLYARSCGEIHLYPIVKDGRKEFTVYYLDPTQTEWTASTYINRQSIKGNWDPEAEGEDGQLYLNDPQYLTNISYDDIIYDTFLIFAEKNYFEHTQSPQLINGLTMLGSNISMIEGADKDTIYYYEGYTDDLYVASDVYALPIINIEDLGKIIFKLYIPNFTWDENALKFEYKYFDEVVFDDPKYFQKVDDPQFEGYSLKKEIVWLEQDSYLNYTNIESNYFTSLGWWLENDNEEIYTNCADGTKLTFDKVCFDKNYQLKYKDIGAFFDEGGLNNFRHKDLPSFFDVNPTEGLHAKGVETVKLYLLIKPIEYSIRYEIVDEEHPENGIIDNEVSLNYFPDIKYDIKKLWKKGATLFTMSNDGIVFIGADAYFACIGDTTSTEFISGDEGNLPKTKVGHTEKEDKTTYVITSGSGFPMIDYIIDDGKATNFSDTFWFKYASNGKVIYGDIVIAVYLVEEIEEPDDPDDPEAEEYIINFVNPYSGGEWNVNPEFKTYTSSSALNFYDVVATAPNGYTFLGWKIQLEDGDIKWTINGDYVVGLQKGSEGNATLMADWHIEEYTITFDIGDIEVTKPEEMIYTVTQNGTFPTFNNVEGYLFNGWDEVSCDGEIKYIVNPSNACYIGFEAGSYGNAVLKANWTELEIYQISFTSEYGTVPAPINYTVKDVGSFATMSYSGKVFLGWELTSGGVDINWTTNAEGYKTGFSLGSEGDATLNAVWIDANIIPEPEDNPLTDESHESIGISVSIIYPSRENPNNPGENGDYTKIELDSVIVDYVTGQKWVDTEEQATMVDPDTGEEVPAVDEEGNPVYKKELVDITVPANKYVFPTMMELYGYYPRAEFKGYMLRGSWPSGLQSGGEASEGSALYLWGNGVLVYEAVFEHFDWANLSLHYANGSWAGNMYVPGQEYFHNTEQKVITIGAYLDAGYWITLPSEYHITPPTPYYYLAGWSRTANLDRGETVEYSAGAQMDMISGDLYAVWWPIQSTINFDLNGGVTQDGSSTIPTLTYDTEISVDFLLGDGINGKYQIARRGYTFMGWAYSGSSNINWKYMPNGSGYVTGIKPWSIGRPGDTVVAVWEENTYTIKLYNTHTSAPSIHDVSYTEIFSLNGYAPTYNGYTFVGWGVTDYDFSQTNYDTAIRNYRNVYSNQISKIGDYSQTTIPTINLSNGLENGVFSGEWGTGYSYHGENEWKDSTEVTDVWGYTIFDHDNAGVTKLNHKGGVFSIYGIWLPEYTLTINKGDGATIYYNGQEQRNLAKFTEPNKNDYNTTYFLYAQQERDVFYTPTRTGMYELHKYGYYISGWWIEVEGEQYYVAPIADEPNDAKVPNPHEWLIKDEDVSKMVQSGINLQYLQGNIVATPQWSPMKFDVIFRTDGSESYKQEKGVYAIRDSGLIVTRDIVYDEDYLIHINKTGVQVIDAIDIYGYTVMYAQPYTANDYVDTNIDNQISLKGTWKYVLEYKQHRAGDAYTYANEGWYICLEGYYMPDLYRLKIDLNLPYTMDNKFELNPNGYNLVTLDNISSLQTSYLPISINPITGEYEQIAEYTSRRGNLYNIDGTYYIYLTQDQFIDNQQVYDRDDYVYDANIDKWVASTDAGKWWALPNFEIAYYEMQYYYTFNDQYEANLFLMADIDEEDEELAKTKIKAKELGDIDQEVQYDYPTNWSYRYCDTNEPNGADYTLFELNVYWYRNIINIEVNNLIDTSVAGTYTDSINGFALIKETEQVTMDTGLQDHSMYNLIIYWYDGTSSQYLTYAFVNADSIRHIYDGDGYNYDMLLELFSTTDEGELLSEYGIQKISNTNTIPIFFGNSFTISVYDQSKDSSRDEFIGYRFVNYEYNLDEVTKCSSFAQFDLDIANRDNEGNEGDANYTMTENLKNYEYDDDGRGTDNTTNYIQDKETVVIDIYFTKIIYGIKYQVTDSDNNLNGKYGNIKLQYDLTLQDDYYQWYITRLVDDTVVSTMKVRLGSELYEWQLVNAEIDYSMALTESQIYELLLNATFLREHLYTPQNNYPIDPYQYFGDINARCGDIEFDINVYIQDISTDTIIDNYQLGSRQKEIFEITRLGEQVNNVLIDNEYAINMQLTQIDGYLYYTNIDDKYAVRGLYIAHSRDHETDALVNKFGYPITELEPITMMVNHSLLNYTVNYTQYIEVDVDNRHLDFYVEVSPIVNLQFEAAEVIDSKDKYKDARSITLNGVNMLTASDGQQLDNPQSYLGYATQEVELCFVANASYYIEAKLTIKYTESEIEEVLSIYPNKTIKYIISYDAVISVELIPAVRNVEVWIVYNDESIDATNYPFVTNASGVPIFDASSGVTVKAKDVTDGIYYDGDKILINYKLNSANNIANEYEVFVYGNSKQLRYNRTESAYVATFNGADMIVEIVVKPKQSEVTILTDPVNNVVAEIYAQVNSGEIKAVLTETVGDEQTNTYALISGDKLTIYVKPNVGYDFSKKYSYFGREYELECEIATGEFEGYTKFTLFNDSGFNLNLGGYYSLMFEQVDINVEFVYYATSEPVGEVVNAGKNYSVTSDTEIIKRDSVVTINKGVDTVGYRFIGYTYVAPRTDAEAVVLNEQFEIKDAILNYLAIDYPSTIVDGAITFKVYVNYIRQYTISYIYDCDSTLVQSSVTDKDGIVVKFGEYRDYGTEVVIDIRTADTNHYELMVTISNGIEDEVITTESTVIDGSLILTNLGELAGFKLDKILTSNYTIRINAKVEKYETQLNQVLYKGPTGGEEITSTNLQEKTENYFHLTDNVYYQVTGNHDYGTRIVVSIFVAKPTDKTKQYYTLTSAYLNEQELRITNMGAGILGEEEGTYYELSYALIGSDWPVITQLDINFKALYHIELN